MSQLFNGNCIEVMKTFQPDSIDTIIIDPPSGINFMGRDWDNYTKFTPVNDKAVRVQMLCKKLGMKDWESGFVSFITDWAIEAMRVAKPGAYSLVWALPRTSDLTTMGLRFAGWQIKDKFYHIFKSGFPKSKDISKLIDRHFGVKRDKVRYKPRPENSNSFAGKSERSKWIDESRKVGYHETDDNNPVSDMTKLWYGYGTGLKPAAEEWIIAMKPVKKNYVTNAIDYGVAGLNLGECRIGDNIQHSNNKIMIRLQEKSKRLGIRKYTNGIPGQREFKTTHIGKFPANVIIDGSKEILEKLQIEEVDPFFYCAKPVESEKTKGIKINNSTKPTGSYSFRVDGGLDGYITKESLNNHPTVKPLSLMEYLCKITKTPSGGIVLDSFMGSGTTGVACINTGRQFIGIEMDKDYFEIAKQRIEHVESLSRQVELF